MKDSLKRILHFENLLNFSEEFNIGDSAREETLSSSAAKQLTAKDNISNDGTKVQEVIDASETDDKLIFFDPIYSEDGSRIIPDVNSLEYGKATGGRYNIVHEIEKQYGKVYIAYDNKIGRKVIIKGYKPYDEEEIIKTVNADVLDEAKRHATVQHPNLSIIHDLAVNEKGGLYLVQELLPGGDMEEWLKEPHSWNEKVKALSEVASALDYLHNPENPDHSPKPIYAYADLKPANIAFGEQGQAKVIDFGSLTLLDPINEYTENIYCTYGLEAPEQNKGKICTKTDIYQFAELLVMMMRNKTDASDTNFVVRCLMENGAHIDEFMKDEQKAVFPFEFLDQDNKKVKTLDKLDSIIKKSLNYDPGQRHSSVQDLLNEFAQVLDRSGVVPKVIAPYIRGD